MAAGQRPGGLTALAVLNFVFGGIAVLALLALAALLGSAENVIDEAARQSGEVRPAMAMLWIGLLLGLVSAVLLIVSGVGYLGQKRFLGRTLGNVYAILSLAGTAFGLAVLNGKFDFSTIIGLVYPVLTLLLINGTFKDDLVN